MLKEFKEFAMRGNVLDMAVGIIIGAAFGKIITSLVGDVSDAASRSGPGQSGFLEFVPQHFRKIVRQPRGRESRRSTDD